MKLKYLVRTAGLSALATAMAVVALPAEASARDHDNGGWSHASHGGQGRADGGAHNAPQGNFRAGGNNRGPQADNRRAQPARPDFAQRRAAAEGIQRTNVPASAARYRGEQANREGWSGNRANATRAEQVRDWQGQRNERRNRSYADPHRDQSYGANRAEHYDGRRGNDAYRHYDRRGDYNHGNYNHGDHDRWNGDWRHDRRYDWHDYRNSHRSVYHLGYYRAPYSSWSYRPLSIGFYLEPLFYSSSYWIDDPWQYRLPDAYGPYRWVRYYDDALLVDVYSGEVVDVIHDFFW